MKGHPGSRAQRTPIGIALGLAASTILAGGAVSFAQSPDAMDYNHTYDRSGTVADLVDIAPFCGTEPIKVGMNDGFGGNSWRKITRAEAEDEAKKCPNITFTYTDGQGDAQKTISDLQGLVAQDYKVIIGFADAAEAMAPAYRDAMEAGVSIVPYIAPPAGATPGDGVTDWVREDGVAYGQSLAAWTIKTMGEKGNLVFLGGQPGNGYSQFVYDQVKAEAAKHPDVHLINLDPSIGDTFVVTDWAPGKTQEVVAGLLTQYPSIDGIVSDYGGGSVGGIRAFQAAGRPIPPWAANDSNEFACLWVNRDPKETNYQIGTVSSRNWISRVALRRALANYNGIQNPEPQIIKLDLSEDSTSTDPALAPKCDPSLPADAILSSQLTTDQLKELFGASSSVAPDLTHRSGAISPMDQSRVVLALTGVTKTFPGVVALRDVTFEVRAGEIHALVGGNGAGKSTLMGIAAGSILPDTGSVEIGGVPMTDPTPLSATRLGLAIVRQEPALLPDLSVAENMWLGVRPSLKGGIGAAGTWTAQCLAPWQVPIDPHARVADLSMHRRFIIEIAKALALEPQVLVLDEPTEHLTAPEIEQLFGFVRAVKERGGSVVYISHRIPEVLRIADRVTVLRDGQARGTFERADVTEADVVKLIVGRAVEKVFPPKRGSAASDPAAEPLLVVDSLSGDGFSGISLTVGPGEVVGLAGVEGNGQRDFLRALAGMAPSTGSILVGDRAVRSNDPIDSRAAGIAYLPQDRQTEALLLELSVRENMALSSLKRFANLGFVQRGAERTAVSGQMESLGIKSPSSETLIRALSGGNQQKVMLARQALAEPRLLLAEEPTQGVDAGARVEIYRILRSGADAGAGVVVVSTDEIELEGLCDRVLIFSRGHVVRELAGDQVTEHNIQEAALTATQLRERQDIAEEQRASRSARFSHFMRGDYGPALVLLLVLLALGAVTALVNPFYLTERNFAGVFQLLTALALVSVAQLIVMLTGGIDLSVGPLTGFLVVVASFFIVDKPDKIFGITGPAGAVAGILAITLAALVVGLFNGLMVRKAHIPPVVVTLATFIGLQGLSLFFRTTPSGQIQRTVTDLIKFKISFVPVVLLLTVALVLFLEYGLRRRQWGLELRAVGSSERAAARLGIRVDRIIIGAYVLCSLVIVLAAFLLMGQIGVGDPASGVSYTLSSITAVVLGGASIYGGRGSFIATLLGAAVLQQVNTVTSFLQLDSSATYLLLGLLTLGAAAVYSTARETKVRA